MVHKITTLVYPEAKQFIDSLPTNAAGKIWHNIHLVEDGNYSRELFKKLNENIWEFRTLYNRR